MGLFRCVATASLIAALLCCNLAVTSAGCPTLYPGAWVKDNSRPAYDSSCPFIGSTNCINQAGRSKEWLSYSWKPASCPAVNSLRFNAQGFLNKMRNRVFASAGESLSHAGFMPSLVCQIARITAVNQLPRPNAYGDEDAYFVPGYNLTIVNFWSQFLSQISRDHAMLKKMGDDNIALEDTVVNVHGLDAWANYLDKIDVMLLQSAVDWPAGKDIMRRWFVDNNWQAINPKPSTYDAYRIGMTTVVNTFAARRAAGKRKPVGVFLSAPPKQTDCQTANGLKNVAEVGNLMRTNRAASQFLPIQRQIFKAPLFSFIPVTELSMYRPDAYMSSGSTANGHDCLHFCLPGVPDTWVDAFYNTFAKIVLP